MERASGFYPLGWGFDSLRAHNREAPMKYVIYQTPDQTVTGYQRREVLDLRGWTFEGEPVNEIYTFEASSSEEAKEKFDAWDDALPRPEERCSVCDALLAEGHTIPAAVTSSPTTLSTAELATGHLSAS
jgi:hypothetical protein